MSIIEQMASELKLRRDFVAATILSANHRYKEYPITKPGGGTRVIAHPAKRLKLLQRWCMQRIFSRLPIHSSAMAYRKGISIADNAALHSQQRFFLKMDFTNFFPSIHRQHVDEIIRRGRGIYIPEYTDDDINSVCRIVCRNGALAVGAPSSPIISNCLFFDFDDYWERYCLAHHLTYSRYADDITFSTCAQNILIDTEAHFRDFSSNYFVPMSVNENKVRHLSLKRRIIVTGLTITSENDISLGRDNKRRIRSLIFKSINGAASQEDIQYIRGYLNFARSVEPSWINRLNQKYGIDVLSI